MKVSVKMEESPDPERIPFYHIYITKPNEMFNIFFIQKKKKKFSDAMRKKVARGWWRKV